MYGKTYGKLDFLWLDHAKQSQISAHDTTTEKNYLPRAPQMKEAKAFVRSVNKVLQANESILTLGGQSPFVVQEPRQKPMTLERHKNSEFSAFLMQHTQPAINTVKRPFEPDERGRQKSTEILDHIIKQRKLRDKKMSETFENVKNDEQKEFVRELVEKKDLQR